MMQLKRLVIILGTTVFPFFAEAAGPNWSMVNEEKRSEISLAFEMVKLEVEDEEINSYGGRIAYKYHLWSKLDVDTFLASTLSTGDGLKPGSTTLGLYGMYNVFDAENVHKAIKVNGETLLSEQSQIENQLRLGVGFEQTFLSGNKGVYSAAGPGFQVNYEHTFHTTKFFVGGRFAKLYSGDLEVKATMFNVGLFFNF